MIIMLILLATIISCMNVATTSAQLVYNRHSIEKNLYDQYLTMQAYQTLYVDRHNFNNTNIVITTYNGEMLLIGQAPSLSQKQQAEVMVKRNSNIKKIYNLVEIRSPSSYLIRMSDSWITTKIKSKLIASSDVDATKVKVVTENGVVYLLGTLESDQANAAVKIARQTGGVRQVVKIFSYVKISKRQSDVVA
jgi:osmotically-inducible protein OsmY